MTTDRHLRSPGVLRGLHRTATLLNEYHDAAARQTALCALAEESCRAHRSAIGRRLDKIGQLQQVLAEEQRCLESEDRDLLAQLNAIAKRRGVISTESTAVAEAMLRVPSLAREEQQVDEQVEAVEARIREMQGLLDSMERRVDAVARDDLELVRAESALADRELALETARQGRRAKELELAGLREQLAARERSVNAWNRKLEHREQDLAVHVASYKRQMEGLWRGGVSGGGGNPEQQQQQQQRHGSLRVPVKTEFLKGIGAAMGNVSIDRSAEELDDDEEVVLGGPSLPRPSSAPSMPSPAPAGASPVGASPTHTTDRATDAAAAAAPHQVSPNIGLGID